MTDIWFECCFVAQAGRDNHPDQYQYPTILEWNVPVNSFEHDHRGQYDPVHFHGFILQCVTICSGNGLTPKSRQAFT